MTAGDPEISRPPDAAIENEGGTGYFFVKSLKYFP
jgi:hypothetical protein